MSAVKKAPDIYEYQNCIADRWRLDLNCQIVDGESKVSTPNHSIGIGLNLTPSQLLAAAIDNNFKHIVQDGSPFMEVEINSSAAMLDDIKRYFSSPVDLILNPEQSNSGRNKIYHYEFTAARQKTEALGKFDDVLKGFSAPGSLRSDLIVVMDELFTNAVYNAPFVTESNNSYGASRKDVSIHMPDGKSGQIFCGTDNERIVIGCSDPFGKLNIGRLLQRVKNCYDTNVADNINFTSPGGAGIGSYLVFNSSTSYFAAVDRDHITQICCVVPIKMSGRVRQGQPKNLHWYEKGEE